MCINIILTRFCLQQPYPCCRDPTRKTEAQRSPMLVPAHPAPSDEPGFRAIGAAEEKAVVQLPLLTQRIDRHLQILPTLILYTFLPEAGHIVSKGSIRPNRLEWWGRGHSGHRLVAARIDN